MLNSNIHIEKIREYVYKFPNQNFFYITNTGRSYRHEYLKSYVSQMFDIKIEDLIKENNPLFPIVVSAQKENRINILEPVMEKIMKHFNNNEFKDLEFMTYNKYGENFNYLLPYIAYYITFYSDGAPFKFFEEIGSESSYNALMASINGYFGTYIHELNVKTLTPTDEQIKKFLEIVLASDAIIKLRNKELEKSEHLMEENLNDQVYISEENLAIAYKRNVEMIKNEIMNHNLISKISTNETKLINGLTNDLDNQNSKYLLLNELKPNQLNKLMELVELFINESQEFSIVNYNFYPRLNTETSIEESPKTIATELKKLVYSIKPFSEADIAGKLFVTYVKQFIFNSQTDLFSENRTGIKVENVLRKKVNSKHIVDKITEEFIKLFVDAYKTTRILEEETKTNISDKELIEFKQNDLKFYIYALCKDEPLNETLTKNKDEKLLSLIDETFSMLSFIDDKSFCELINTLNVEYIKFLALTNKIEIPYLAGNDDDVDKLNIGGTYLYDLAINQNSIIRSIEYIRNTSGTNYELEFIYEHFRLFSDITSLNIINEIHKNYADEDISKFNTVYEIMSMYFTPLTKRKIDTETLKLILNHYVNQTVSNFITNEFRSRSIKLDQETISMIPQEVTVKKFDFSPVSVIDDPMKTLENSYTIPLYKIVSSFETVGLNFTNPTGTILRKFDIEKNNKMNYTIFCFGNYIKEDITNIF